MGIDEYACQLWNFVSSNEIANVATAFGVPIALFGGYLALQSLRSSKRIAASAHIHNLFQDYLGEVLVDLRHAPDRSTDDKRESRVKTIISEQMAGLKLYALEEMYVWIRDQERTVWLDLGDLFSKRRREFRADTLNSWRATIREHARRNASEMKRDIREYTTCYSVEFLEFVADAISDEELKQIVREQRRALTEGKQRPLGEVERQSMAKRAEMEGV